MALRGKMQEYAKARAEGLEPGLAAAHAGYEGAGLRVTIARIEAREDFRAEVKRLRRGGKSKGSAAANDIEHLLGKGDTKDKWVMKDHYASPLELMRDVMNNPEAPRTLRYQAAKDALPYCHARKEGGKKEDETDAAKKVAKGSRFGTTARPRLHSVK